MDPQSLTIAMMSRKGCLPSCSVPIVNSCIWGISYPWITNTALSVGIEVKKAVTSNDTTFPEGVVLVREFLDEIPTVMDVMG